MNPAVPSPALPLKDIHLPEAVSWWPLAPGWWGLIILALLLVGLFFLGRTLYRRGMLRREAQKALQDISARYKIHKSDQQLAADLSALLRRISISQHPRAEVASLTDDAWLCFLDCGVANSSFSDAFSTGAGRTLMDAPYKQAVNIDSTALLEICTAWIDSLPHKPRVSHQ